ncbi:MAG: DUF1861 family protein [Chloroflexota bacterium]
MRKVYDMDLMLREYRANRLEVRGQLVSLLGIGEMDGYNPSNPISDGRYPRVYVRVEPRDMEFATWSVPFRQLEADRWEMESDIPMLRLQDPFAATIHGTLVVGGVRILSKLRDEVVWETVLLKGDSPSHLQEFARSPEYMKDVRLAQLEDGRIGVFTRPWGTEANSRQIGYQEVDGLGEVAGAMATAPVLETQPVEGQWWGANAVYVLGNGKLGVLAHIAKWEGTRRRYYPIAFVFDRVSRAIVHGPHIVADRSCFPAYEPKLPDLGDVIFPAWIDREKGLFFGGLSDTAIGVMPLDDPFRAWDSSVLEDRATAS